MLTRSRPPPLLPTHQPSTKQQQQQRSRTQHTSNNKNGCCFGMDRLTFGIVLVWIIFIVWCTLLYQYGFLSKNSSSSLNDNTIESVNNNNNKDNDDLYAKLFQLQQQQQQQQQLNNPIINTNNNNNNNNNDDKKTTTTTTTVTTTSNSNNSNNNNKNGVIPIVVIAYQRANELKKCLDTLFRYKPDENDDQFHIYVSQDGYHEGVSRVARSYGNRVTLFQRERKIQLPAVPVGNNPSYYALSQHYKFAVNQVFAQQTIRLPNVNYERIILLEEDLEVAPDFYSYFSALSPLLEQDSSLLCISAWNDNGMRGYVNDATRLYRSDFFPGLGWMITKQLWENELRDVWPLGYWDDWLREAGSRRGRNCIRPEINRTYTFGAKGTSGGQFGRYLDAIQLNDQNIDWKSIDVSYIRDKKRYDEELQQLVDRAEAVNPHQVRTLDKKDHVLKILYNNPHHYESISKQIGIFPELKAGVPRGAYHGVVSLKYKDNVVLLVPSSNRAEPMTYTNDPPYPPRPQ